MIGVRELHVHEPETQPQLDFLLQPTVTIPDLRPVKRPNYLMDGKYFETHGILFEIMHAGTSEERFCSQKHFHMLPTRRD